MWLVRFPSFHWPLNPIELAAGFVAREDEAVRLKNVAGMGEDALSAERWKRCALGVLYQGGSMETLDRVIVVVLTGNL